MTNLSHRCTNDTILGERVTGRLRTHNTSLSAASYLMLRRRIEIGRCGSSEWISTSSLSIHGDWCTTEIVCRW